MLLRQECENKRKRGSEREWNLFFIFGNVFLKKNLELLKVFSSHAHALPHACKANTKLKRPRCCLKPETEWFERSRELWSNRVDGGCLTSTTVNCTCVYQWCALILIIFPTCTSTTLEVCFELRLQLDTWRGEGRETSYQRVIFLLSFKSMNFHLYLFYLLSRFGLGSRGVSAFAFVKMGALFTDDIKNCDRIVHG